MLSTEKCVILSHNLFLEIVPGGRGEAGGGGLDSLYFVKIINQNMTDHPTPSLPPPPPTTCF